MDKINSDLKNAEKFDSWLKTRGGIAHWTSIDLSDLGASCCTPALTVEGKPYPKPHWKYANEPEYIVTSPDAVELTTAKEVKRFHVAVRVGSQGFSVKCTDASSARIRREVDKAGEGAWYEFDYEAQEAVIFVPDSIITLTEWRKHHEKN
jgi:hypothetical protein